MEVRAMVRGAGGWQTWANPAFYRTASRAAVFRYLKAVGNGGLANFQQAGLKKMCAYICIYKFITNFTDMSNTKFTIIKHIMFFIVNSIQPFDSHRILPLIFARFLCTQLTDACDATIIDRELHSNLLFPHQLIVIKSDIYSSVKLFPTPHTNYSH